MFIQEVTLLSELRHPNVILYMGVCVDTRDKIIVTEYMENGSLYNLLRLQKLKIMTVHRIAKDIALGMNYLHEENVLHRDLTSRNILLTKHMQAKVADFGLSKKNLKDSDLSYTMGSVPWMAPEVIASARQFSKKADVYSFGVICWELFTGSDPCPEDMAHVNLANKVLHEEWRPSIPENVPFVWTQLIKQCWAQKPDSRPLFIEILAILDSIEMNPPFPMGPMDPPPPQEDDGSLNRDKIVSSEVEDDHGSVSEGNEDNQVEVGNVEEDRNGNLDRTGTSADSNDSSMDDTSELT